MKRIIILGAFTFFTLYQSFSQELKSSFILKNYKNDIVTFESGCNKLFEIDLKPDSIKKEVRKHMDGTFEVKKGDVLIFNPLTEFIVHKKTDGSKYISDIGFDGESTKYEVNKNDILRLRLKSKRQESFLSNSKLFYLLGFLTSFVVAPTFILVSKKEPKEVVSSFKNIFLTGVGLGGVGVVLSIAATPKSYYIKAPDISVKEKWSFD
ncbi:MAG: hypothetical protein JNK41_04530 [Saprospiraceae bacterium]|jgi:hypothetical protein|nr:hypothetical protein [Saprospiraceae bacterium]